MLFDPMKACLLVLLVSSGVSAQSTLPSTLESRFRWNDTVSFWLRPGATGPSASVSFDTAEKELHLEWSYDIPGTLGQYPVGFVSSGTREDELSLSYHPLAACREAGVSPVFYIAGWADRLQMLVVERIEVQGITIGTTMTPTGTVVGTLSLSYEKSIVFASDELGPVRCMEYHHTSDRLWLLEDAAPNRVLEVDPVAGDFAVLTNAAAFPALAGMRSMRSIYVDPAAPDGGGFFLLCLPEPEWELVQEDLQDPQSPVFFTRDTDFDGVPDEVVVTTLADAEDDIDYDHYVSKYP